jgi:hypothetical protein
MSLRDTLVQAGYLMIATGAALAAWVFFVGRKVITSRPRRSRKPRSRKRSAPATVAPAGAEPTADDTPQARSKSQPRKENSRTRKKPASRKEKPANKAGPPKTKTKRS